MAFIFAMRSTLNGAGHCRDVSSGTLPVISEDDNGDDIFTPSSPKSHSSLIGTRYYPGPATYISESSESRVSVEKPLEIPKKFGLLDTQLEKRGGWKRLIVIIFVIIICLVGIILGITFGVGKRNQNINNSFTSQASPSPSLPPSTLNTTFPAGFYRFETVLNTTSTDCTSNPATYRCYPYSTYSESPSTATAIFDWIIQPTVGDDSVYSISSTDNPFSLSFINSTMTLKDANTENERYSFQVAMKKSVIPAAPIGESGYIITCYFNFTIFDASIYTRKPKSYPLNSSISKSTNLKPWPYATSMVESTLSGSTTPQCFDTQGIEVGDFSVPSDNLQCNCAYANYNI